MFTGSPSRVKSCQRVQLVAAEDDHRRALARVCAPERYIVRPGATYPSRVMQTSPKPPPWALVSRCALLSLPRRTGLSAEARNIAATTCDQRPVGIPPLVKASCFRTYTVVPDDVKLPVRAGGDIRAVQCRLVWLFAPRDLAYLSNACVGVNSRVPYRLTTPGATRGVLDHTTCRSPLGATTLAVLDPLRHRPLSTTGSGSVHVTPPSSLETRTSVDVSGSRRDTSAHVGESSPAWDSSPAPSR